MTGLQSCSVQYWNSSWSIVRTCCLLFMNLPLLVMRVWSSVRSGLLFSHWMYFFHISTCWASCGEFWGGTEGAFRSKPFITVSYSWKGLKSHHQHTVGTERKVTRSRRKCYWLKKCFRHQKKSGYVYANPDTFKNPSFSLHFGLLYTLRLHFCPVKKICFLKLSSGYIWKQQICACEMKLHKDKTKIYSH